MTVTKFDLFGLASLVILFAGITTFSVIVNGWLVTLLIYVSIIWLASLIIWGAVRLTQAIYRHD